MSLSDSIAELSVNVNMNLANFQAGARQVSDTLHKTDQESEGFMSKFKEGFAMATGFSALGLVESGFERLRIGIVDTNSELEQSTISWTTFLGTTDLAAKKIKELTDFSKVTPYRFSELDEAARQMEVLGGSALDTVDNLKMFGDAASATGRPLKEVAFWSAELYSKAQGGQSFGHALQSLQQLGEISGVTRKQLEDLQKSGASGDTIWAAYSKALGRYSGDMEKQSTSFKGRMSTLLDVVDLSIAKAGKPIFQIMSNSLQGLIDLMGDGTAFESFTSWIADTLPNGLTYLGDSVKPIIDTFKNFSEAFNTLSDKHSIIEKLTFAFSDFASSAGAGRGVINFIESIGDNAKKLVDSLGSLKDKILDYLSPLSDYIKPFALALAGVVGAFAVGSATAGYFGIAVAGAIAMIGTALDTVAPEVLLLGLAVGILTSAWINDFGNIREKIQSLKPYLSDVSDFIGQIGNRIEPIAGWVVNIVTNLSSISFSGIFYQFQVGIQSVANLLAPFVDFLKSVDWKGILDKLGNAADFVWSNLKSFWSWLGQVFGPIFSWIGEQITKAWNVISGLDWSKAWDTLKSGVAFVWNLITQFATYLQTLNLGDRIQQFGQWLLNTFSPVWAFIQTQVGNFITYLQSINVGQALQNYYTFLFNVFSTVWNWLLTQGTNFITWLQNLNVGTKLHEFYQFLITTFAPAFEFVKNKANDFLLLLQNAVLNPLINSLLSIATNLILLGTQAWIAIGGFDGLYKSAGNLYNSFTLLVGSSISTVFNAIVNNAPLAVTWLKNVADTILTFLTPALSFYNQVESVNYKANTQAMTDLTNSFNKNIKDITTSFKGAGDSLTSLSSNQTAMNNLWAMGKTILEAFAILIGITLIPLVLLFGLGITVLIGIVGGLTGAFANAKVYIVRAMEATFELVTSIIHLYIHTFQNFVILITDLLSGNWKKAWDDAGTLIKDWALDILKIWGNMWLVIYNVLFAYGSAITGYISGFINAVIEFWKHLYDVLVGHSIVPDLVKAILSWFVAMGTGIGIILSSLGSFFITAWQFIVDGTYNFANAMVRPFTFLRDILHIIGNDIKTNFVNMLNGLIGNINSLINSFNSLPGTLKLPTVGLISNGGDDFKSSEIPSIGKAGSIGSDKAPVFNINVTLAGNTLLGKDSEIARQLASILAPELSRQIKLAK